jgi:hypothetical protein
VATSKVHSLIVEKRDLVVNSASKSCLIIMHWRMGIDRDTTAFYYWHNNYVIPASHNQFCQESLLYITAATALLTTIATTFYQLLL